MTHNLRDMARDGNGGGIAPYALEFQDWVKQRIDRRELNELADYRKLSRAGVRRARNSMVEARKDVVADRSGRGIGWVGSNKPAKTMIRQVAILLGACGLPSVRWMSMRLSGLSDA